MGGTSLMRMCKKLESMFWKQNGSSIAAPGCQKNFSIYQNSCERSHCLQGIRFMTFLWKRCSKSGRLRSPEMFSNRDRKHKLGVVSLPACRQAGRSEEIPSQTYLNFPSPFPSPQRGEGGGEGAKG